MIEDGKIHTMEHMLSPIAVQPDPASAAAAAAAAAAAVIPAVSTPPPFQVESLLQVAIAPCVCVCVGVWIRTQYPGFTEHLTLLDLLDWVTQMLFIVNQNN